MFIVFNPWFLFTVQENIQRSLQAVFDRRANSLIKNVTSENLALDGSPNKVKREVCTTRKAKMLKVVHMKTLKWNVKLLQFGESAVNIIFYWCITIFLKYIVFESFKQVLLWLTWPIMFRKGACTLDGLIAYGWAKGSLTDGSLVC